MTQTLYKKFALALAVMLMISFLAACGFKLRGYQPLPQTLRVESIYIESARPFGLLVQLLKQIFRSLQVNLVDSPTQAALILKLYNEDFSSRPLSDSASSETKEYLLNYVVTYELINKQGELLYGPKTIATSRTYMVNEAQVLSSGNEQDTLRIEIQRDAAYQILNQLNSPDVAKALGSEPVAKI